MRNYIIFRCFGIYNIFNKLLLLNDHSLYLRTLYRVATGTNLIDIDDATIKRPLLLLLEWARG